MLRRLRDGTKYDVTVIAKNSKTIGMSTSVVQFTSLCGLITGGWYIILFLLCFRTSETRKRDYYPVISYVNVVYDTMDSCFTSESVQG